MTEDQRDAHLREALRHAPDAQLQPPPALSALILNEARAKARDASAPARVPRHRLAALWDWLARPAVTTGFAGVMVATLVGLMWWDQPMDEAMPRRPAPAATAPAPAEAPVVPAPAPAPAPATPPPAAAKTPPPAAAEAARPAPPPRPAQRKPAPAAEKAAPAAPAPTMRDVPAASAEPAREAAPAAVAPPAPPAAADTAGVAVPREKSADESKRLRSMAPNQALSGRAAKAELSESRQRQEADTRTLLASLRASIAAEPARWAWQRGSVTVHAMNDALYAWLAQLDDTIGTAWQPVATGSTAPSPSGELRLLRDGRVLHSLRLSERGVWWQREQGGAWHTELTSAHAHTLQTALEAAAP